jgi:O-antigen/teichoic acid export membrane protein
MITEGTTIAVVLNILLSILLVKYFGYVGAAYGTVISKFALFGIHWYFSKKIDRNSIFGGNVVCIMSLILISLNFIIAYTMDFVYVRYFILVIIAIFYIGWVYTNRKEMLAFLKKR